MNNYAEVYASAGASADNSGASAQACYGARLGYSVYAQVNAP